jgi:hypothetical protein
MPGSGRCRTISRESEKDMTTETTDDGIASKPDESQPQNGTIVDADFVEEDDPIIAEMRAAEAEIAAAGTGTQPAAAAEGEPEAQQGAEQPAAAAAQPPKTIMVPKARLDAALSKSDLYRDQVAYLQGVLDAKKGGSQAAASWRAPAQVDVTNARIGFRVVREI